MAKIRIIDKIKNNITELELHKRRNLEHFNIQLKNKSHVFRDKTKYNRKEKHKERY